MIGAPYRTYAPHIINVYYNTREKPHGRTRIIHMTHTTPVHNDNTMY